VSKATISSAEVFGMGGRPNMIAYIEWNISLPRLIAHRTPG
jgi:hypothetical protein